MKKLLIAIKSEAICTALVNELSRYEVHICDTDTDVLATLELLRPDILILDLRLPRMDGITILQKAHHKPRFILALTDLITDSVLVTAADVGIQDVILIPCTIRHVLNHLNALTEKAPSTEA